MLQVFQYFQGEEWIWDIGVGGGGKIGNFGGGGGEGGGVQFISKFTQSFTDNHTCMYSSVQYTAERTLCDGQ